MKLIFFLSRKNVIKHSMCWQAFFLLLCRCIHLGIIALRATTRMEWENNSNNNKGGKMEKNLCFKPFELVYIVGWHLFLYLLLLLLLSIFLASYAKVRDMEKNEQQWIKCVAVAQMFTYLMPQSKRCIDLFMLHFGSWLSLTMTQIFMALNHCAPVYLFQPNVKYRHSTTHRISAQWTVNWLVLILSPNIKKFIGLTMHTKHWIFFSHTIHVGHINIIKKICLCAVFFQRFGFHKRRANQNTIFPQCTHRARHYCSRRISSNNTLFILPLALHTKMHANKYCRSKMFVCFF